MSTGCGEPVTAADPGGLAAAFCSLVARTQVYMGLQHRLQIIGWGCCQPCQVGLYNLTDGVR